MQRRVRWLLPGQKPLAGCPERTPFQLTGNHLWALPGVGKLYLITGSDRLPPEAFISPDRQWPEGATVLCDLTPGNRPINWVCLSKSGFGKASRTERFLMLYFQAALFYYSCQLWNPANISFGSISKQSKIHLQIFTEALQLLIQALLLPRA